MITKICRYCKEKKLLNAFNKNPSPGALYGYDSWCKDCAKLAKNIPKGRSFLLLQRLNPRARTCIICKKKKLLEAFCQDKTAMTDLSSHCRLCQKSIAADYYIRRKDFVSIQSRAHEDRKDPERIRRRVARAYKKLCKAYKGPKKPAIRHKRTKEARIQHEIKRRLSKSIGQALKRQGTRKSAPTQKLLGTSVPEFIAYIESKFEPGMSWEKRETFHLDHIIPLDAFDLTDPIQQRIAWHHTNLQPLVPGVNISKGTSVPENFDISTYIVEKRAELQL